MTDITKGDVTDDTPIGAAIGGRLAGWNIIWDALGSEILGQLIANPDPNSITGRLKTLATLMGALVDSPDALSVVGRLKSILAAIAALGTENYALANGSAGLAVGAGTTPVTIARGAYYFFDASFAGTSPSLALQRLGADGQTWFTVATRTAVGAGTEPVGLMSGSQYRLYNSGTNALTAVAGRLG